MQPNQPHTFNVDAPVFQPGRRPGQDGWPSQGYGQQELSPPMYLQQQGLSFQHGVGVIPQGQADTHYDVSGQQQGRYPAYGNHGYGVQQEHQASCYNGAYNRRGDRQRYRNYDDGQHQQTETHWRSDQQGDRPGSHVTRVTSSPLPTDVASSRAMQQQATTAPTVAGPQPSTLSAPAAHEACVDHVSSTPDAITNSKGTDVTTSNAEAENEQRQPAPATVDDAYTWEAEADEVAAVNTKAPAPTSIRPPLVVESSPTAPPSQQHHPAEEEESEEVVDEEPVTKSTKLKQPDPRPHLNVVFIGHVDAGKSTTCGNILVLTGQVDQRTLEKYEREAKEKNRESWFYAFIVDINEEERQKGKTVEVGRATFELEKTRFTILDAPGHKGFVPNMIGGAAQADVGVLIISARKGEFETGFERGGQTREHAMLAKTLGVSQLIVAVNKMDDPTCDWDEQRYREIEKKLIPFLRSCGYNPAKDIIFVPISGLSGQNLKLHAADPSFREYQKAQWYGRDQPTLLSILDNLKPPERDERAPLRIPLLEGFRDQGVVTVGKVEAGTVVAGQSGIIMPKNIKVKVLGVAINDEEVAYAKPGENVSLKVTGIQEDQITRGSVLCCLKSPCAVATLFKAQIIIVDLLEHRPLMTAGYSCVIHAHTASDECQVMQLLETVDRATKKKKLNPQFVRSNSLVVCTIQLASHMCLEVFEERPQLGRFTLRDEGKTIAVGKVLEITGKL